MRLFYKSHPNGTTGELCTSHYTEKRESNLLLLWLARFLSGAALFFSLELLKHTTFAWNFENNFLRLACGKRPSAAVLTQSIHSTKLGLTPRRT